MFRKIGIPPYHLNQIIPILDEASSWISNSEKPSAQFYSAIVETIESLEALAWLIANYPTEMFLQFPWVPGLAVDQQTQPYVVWAQPAKRAVLDSIGPKTLHLKDWLFDGFQLSQISRSALGTARLCQYCNWPFRRIARGPNSHPPDLPHRISFVCGQPHYLLANDHWPDFPVLEERSLQGCEFCLLLHKHLLSLVLPRPAKFDAKPVSVWIGFIWDEGTRSLELVQITLRGYSPCIGKRLYFTIDTTTGRCDRRWLRIRIEG